MSAILTQRCFFLVLTLMPQLVIHTHKFFYNVSINIAEGIQKTILLHILYPSLSNLSFN